MKKIIIIFIFLPFTFISIKAQYNRPTYTSIDKYEVLDSAFIEFHYELKFIKNVKDTTKVSNDIKVLQVGKNISKFFSFYVLKHDSLCQDLTKKGSDFFPNNPQSGAQGYEVFKNYPQGKITYTDKGTCLFDNFIYEENMPDFKWKIISDKAIILNYLCQKATTYFRGRDYEAWFTTEIPIPNGPWKFGGLPGLILKVQDSQRHFVFECTSIYQLKTLKKAILFYKIDYTKIKREDLAKLYLRYHDAPTSYHESLGSELMFMGSDGVARVDRNAKFPYNPIELE